MHASCIRKFGTYAAPGSRPKRTHPQELERLVVKHAAQLRKSPGFQKSRKVAHHLSSASGSNCGRLLPKITSKFSTLLDETKKISAAGQNGLTIMPYHAGSD